MSRNPSSRLHPSRPSSWAWSGVVLFSTLLLSPVASANLLSALARALPQWASPAAAAQTPYSPRPAAAAFESARRTSEEEAARVLLQSVLGRDTEADETEPDLVRPQVVATVRAVYANWPIGFYRSLSASLPADVGGAPAPACVRLRASRAPPLV